MTNETKQTQPEEFDGALSELRAAAQAVDLAEQWLDAALEELGRQQTLDDAAWLSAVREVRTLADAVTAAYKRLADARVEAKKQWDARYGVAS
jgi:hypothetical protein